MPDDNAARSRLIIIQMVRLSGVVMAMIGALILRDKIAAPDIVGHALVVAGLIDILVVPLVLARKWRTPPA